MKRVCLAVFCALLSAALCAISRADENTGLLDKALTDPWSNSALNELVGYHRANVSIGELTRELARLADEKDENSAGALVVLGRVLYSAGDHRRAADSFRRATEAGDTSVRTRDVLAGILTELEQLDDAKAVLLEAVKLSTDRHKTADFYRRLGLIESMRGDGTAARKFWGKIIELDLGSFEAYRDVAEIMVEQSYIHDAIELYRELHESSGDPQTAAMAQFEIGRLHDDLSLHVSANQAYRAAIGGLAADHWLRYEILRRILDDERAQGKGDTLEELLKGLAGRPKDSRLRTLLIDAQADAGRLTEAVTLAREGARLAPNDAAASAKLAGVLRRAGDMEGYAAELERRISLGGAAAAIYEEAARGLLKRGEREDHEKTEDYRILPAAGHVTPPPSASALQATSESSPSPTVEEYLAVPTCQGIFGDMSEPVCPTGR